jgi:transcriptional regulator with XRE-family HTH domain
MMPAMSTETRRQTRNRPSLAAEDRDLAREVGVRLKAARTRAGLTQRELAEPRYTKAYVSALENGLIKPSMAALRFLARRLGTVPEAFLADADTHWEQLEAELRLATGDWQAAADRFDEILERDPSGVGRGMCQLGLAEATYRLGRPFDAIGHATEARELLTAGHRTAEAQRATYWLAAAHHAANDPARARMLLEELLASTESSAADPDLRVRILVALATTVSYNDEASVAIGLLEEARRIGADLDDRRRATLLYTLAQSYRISGDLEAAVRNGTQSLALFRAVEARAETALIENELALTYLELGNLAAAERHLQAGRVEMGAANDDFRMAHLADTEARIALAGGDVDRADRLAAEATGLAERTGNSRVLLSSLLTAARTARVTGDVARATTLLETAAAAAESAPHARLREVLTEWSELAADAGDHARAYELSRRALALN